MVNHFNFKELTDGRLLLTNDFGYYAVLRRSDVFDLIRGKLSSDTDLYGELREKHFIIEREDLYSDRIKEQLRDAKGYLFSSTALHIFVVTDMCNAECVYCQARTKDHPSHGLMTNEIGERAADIALQSPAMQLTFEFQGGEPLINFSVIKHIVEYTEENKKDKEIEYTIVSNLSLLSDEIVSFFKKYNFKVSTSVDGPRELHDCNRPLVSKHSSFDFAKMGITKTTSAQIPTGAIETTTRKSLQYPEEIIQAYSELGLDSIFLRMLTPLGFAKEEWAEIGYSAEEYLEFYKAALNRIIELNKLGKHIIEKHAVIFLRKILDGSTINYIELRSPCGASVGQLAYYYNGYIFTCDEARMVYEAGDPAFLLGNVFSSSYSDLMQSKTCKGACAASILESLPECCDCVYMPYCGVCPVINYATERDPILQYARGYRCKIYSGILDYLFNLLINGDHNTKTVLWSWAGRD